MKMAKNSTIMVRAEPEESQLIREINGNLQLREEGEGRTFTLSFSSEEPYDRYYEGPEILDHTEGCVDLSRLNSIGVLLFNHKRDDVIGKITKTWIEGSKAFAEVTFDDDEASEGIYQKVKSGTLKGVSVGYMVNVWERVATGKKSTDGRFVGPCYIAKRWTPYEISIVSVPADPTVGVGRSLRPVNFKEDIMDEELREENGGAAAPNPAQVTGGAPAVNADEIRSQERTRVSEISNLAREFHLDPTEAINNGTTVDAYRGIVLEHLRTQRAPIRTGTVEVTLDEGDKFRAAASDALILRAGMQLDKPADGARQLMALSMKDMAIEALAMEGHNALELHRKSPEEIYNMAIRGFYNPTSAFPSILDNTIEKAYVEAYNHTETTFQYITTKGTLTDFKTHDNNYIAGPVGEFLEVPENGEIKHDIFEDGKLPTRKLRTYGRQFTLSRQAFINDDIGLVTSLPARYAASSKRTINKQVYTILGTNPVIYDGANLFCSAHKNVLATGSPVTQSSVQTMIMALATHTDQFGEAINIRPATITVPIGLAFDMYTLFNSQTINMPDNTQATNPLYQYRNKIEVVEEALLNSMAGGLGNIMPWYMFGDKNDVSGIQVDYLNGQEIPNIRRSEKAGTLGFIWDFYLDWGISIMDWRGIVKNPGVAVNLKEALA